MAVKVFRDENSGLEVTIGKYATQANGSAWIKHGDNVVLSTAVASPEPKEFMGFFPLSVEYREKTSAVGKIPGGYFKREGKLTDVEVLTSRLIDRSIRPLFPKYYFNEVQVLSTVYSYDGTFPSSVLSIVSTSLALSLSDIPFNGPVGAVTATKLNGKWYFNSSFRSSQEAEAELTISGTEAGLLMLEGNANRIQEAEIVDVLLQAQEMIRSQIKWQKRVITEAGKEKVLPAPKIDWVAVREKVKEIVTEDLCRTVFVPGKKEREAAIKAIKQQVVDALLEEVEAMGEGKTALVFLTEDVMKERFPKIIAEKQSRFDGRRWDEIRQLQSEVGILPCVHGSAMFRRGETQVLASVTLGTEQDAQRMDMLLEEESRTFMVHYNFPPFATGEIRPMRGVGRREIGHGYLAERAFYAVIPSQSDFPYVVRSLVDTLGSHGSSSMATVCATSMALMDAGVPISEAVAGIAMGVMRDPVGGGYKILTDISGTEDHFGLMDFKVAGTESGVTAIQMDVKEPSGFSRELLLKAMEQAKQARMQILSHMSESISAPRQDISSRAPRVYTFKIPVGSIGAVIGPSGKTIREIVSTTGTEIDIKDDGTVRVYAKDKKSASKAELWVKTIAGDIQPGMVFNGKVKRIADFGILVELVPGKDGLVHVSMISRDKKHELNRLVRVGDELRVKVLSYDSDTGRVRLMAPSLAR